MVIPGFQVRGRHAAGFIVHALQQSLAVYAPQAEESGDVVIFPQPVSRHVVDADIDQNAIAVSPFHHQIVVTDGLILIIYGLGDRAMVAAILVSLQVVAAQ